MGGSDLVSTMPRSVCRKVEDMGPFFWHQVNEMNEKMSLKDGWKICCSILYVEFYGYIVQN